LVVEKSRSRKLPQQSVFLSVIVPAYNEAERLPSTLRRLQQYLSQSSYTYEILVVLDGPTDATADVLREMSGEIDRLRIIERAVNRGKGYAVREGMLEAIGQVRLFTDADNSTDIAHFDKMKPLFDEGYDVVIASRSPKDASGARQVVPQAWHKRVVGQMGNALVQLFAVRGIWDTQCGFKAFSAEAAQRIFARTTIDDWAFDIEVLALARTLNFKTGIIPAQWINDPRSHVRPFDYVRVLGDMFRVWFNVLTRKCDL
jgi:glycosyltransferase involved in cell wall biosynthesis